MNTKKCITCNTYPRPVIGTKCYWCGCSIFNEQKALMHAKRCSNKPRDCDGVFWCLCEMIQKKEEDDLFVLQHTVERFQRMKSRRSWTSCLTVPKTSPFQGYQTNQPFSGLPYFSKNKGKLCYFVWMCVFVWMWWVLIKVYKFLPKFSTKKYKY